MDTHKEARQRSIRALAALLSLGWLAAPPAAAQPGPAAAARVLCRVSDNGVDAAGWLSHPASGAGADCAAGLELPPGWHRLQVHLAAAPGAAVETRWVQLPAGARTRFEVEFETGEVVLRTSRRGEPVAGEADVWRNGSICARLRSGLPVKLPIGAYVLDTRALGQRRRFEAVHVAPRGYTVVTWNVRP